MIVHLNAFYVVLALEHFLHSARPCVSAKLPAEQRTQCAAVLAPRVLLARPMPQGVQVLDRAVLLYEPLAQLRHASMLIDPVNML